MLQLNDDCLRKIIGYLDQWDQVHLVQAFSAYRFIVQDNLKPVCNLKLELLQQRTSLEIKELFKIIGYNIEEITGYIKYLNMNEIIATCIIEHCPNVKTLSFRHVDHFHIEQYISKFSPQLFINDEYYRGIPKFLKLLEHFNNITTLNLSFCALCDETIAQFPNMPKLEILRVARNLDLEGKYLNKFETVTELILYGNRNLKSIYFINVCESLKELKTLNLLYCQQLSLAFSAIADNCKNLEKLTVSCKDDDTEAIHLARLPKLKSLSLHSTEALKSDILAAFVQENTPLESLCIINNKYSIEQITQIGRLISLKEFQCPNSNNLTDDCLIEIAKLANLEKLRIWNCQSFTKVGVLEVLRKCSNLSYLDIGGCHSITQDLVFDAIEILKSRKPLKEKLILSVTYNNEITNSIEKDPRYKAAISLLELKGN